jgi:hypothetical protein
VILHLSEGKSSAEDDGLSIGESHSQRLEGSFKLFCMVLVGHLLVRIGSNTGYVESKL